MNELPDTAPTAEVIEKVNQIVRLLNSSRSSKQSLTVREAADQLGCTRVTVYGLIGDGSLPAYRYRARGAYRIRAEDLNRFLEEDSESEKV